MLEQTTLKSWQLSARHSQAKPRARPGKNERAKAVFEEQVNFTTNAQEEKGPANLKDDHFRGAPKQTQKARTSNAVVFMTTTKNRSSKEEQKAEDGMLSKPLSLKGTGGLATTARTATHRRR